MASFTCKILALFTICMALQEGCGLPLSQQPEQAPPHPRHIRTKRCSCYNWEDKECIYFCHLDIIWINTPSKLLPYGMGSPLSRRRRSANRCECHDPADNTCRGFCHKSSENPGTEAAEPTVEPASIKSNRLLASLSRDRVERSGRKAEPFRSHQIKEQNKEAEATGSATGTGDPSNCTQFKHKTFKLCRDDNKGLGIQVEGNIRSNRANKVEDWQLPKTKTLRQEQYWVEK